MSAQNPSIHLSKINPWFIEETIKSVLSSKPKDIQKLKSGDILIEIDNYPHCEKLLRCTTLSEIQTKTNISVRTRPHQVLNFSKGVIRSRDIGMCNEEEIMNRLRQQGIKNVKCVTRKTQEGVIRTGTYFLTFDTPDLPEYVYAGYIRIPVSPFIPNPLRCFNCQRLGHGQSNCKNPKACWKCSSPNHSSENCTSEPFCVNCKEKHPSSDKKCKSWLKEKEIQKYKVLNKCSFPDARKAIDIQYTNPSYASVTKSKTIDSATQTDIGTQVSGEEIDAEIKKAPSSQKCAHCHHCQSSLQIPNPPKQALFQTSQPTNGHVSSLSETSVSQPKPTSSSSNIQSSSAPLDNQTNMPTPQNKNQTKTPVSNISQPQPTISNIKETTPLPTSNKYGVLDNEEIELTQSDDENSPKRPNEKDFKPSKSERKKQRKKQRLADLRENRKDKRPPKGANNPLDEACLSEDAEEEAMELSQTSHLPSSKVQLKQTSGQPPPQEVTGSKPVSIVRHTKSTNL